MSRATCSVPGCTELHRSRGFCRLHYGRWRRYGDPRADTPARVTVRIAPDAICSIDGCGRRPKSHGWCDKHYQRWQHHGDPLYTEIVYGDDESRFWQKVDKNGPSPSRRPDLGPCWLWMAAVDDGGYGTFAADGRGQKAHRWAFSHFVRPVPDELEVDHLCSVRGCVNYERHLEVVTPLVNTRRIVGGNATKTACKNGHPFTPENTYRRPEGGRKCRVCTNDAQRRLKARRLATE